MSALNDNVLVLTRHWCAVNVAPVWHVFGRLFNDHLRVVHGEYQTATYNQWREMSYGYTGDVVRTASYQLMVPSVVLLTKFDRLPHKEVRYTRQNVYERDGHRCQYCGEKFAKDDLNLDHVIPREHGGESTWENIVCSCIACNTLKANRTPAQAHMRLIKMPKRPQWRPFVAVRMDRVMRPEWARYMDVATWDVQVTHGHK
jgi:5-methylcytosine-specific restriction endonuclease McrA